MPGETQIIEGRVVVEDRIGRYKIGYVVEGLQEALEKWVGRKVSIIIEDVTE